MNLQVIKTKSRFYFRFVALGLAFLLMGIGTYIFSLLLTPEIQPIIYNEWNEPVNHNTIKDNRIYIPKIKVNIPFKDGDAEVLNSNAWHRFAERGNPEKGGNFILAAHRFEVGLTPQETRRKSPFYHLNKLEPGDKLYVDFNNVRYEYEITRRYRVEPTQIEIEEPTQEAKMTLYTCTLKGERDGREVLDARLIRRGIDPQIKFEQA